MTDSPNATDEYDYDEIPTQIPDIYQMHQMMTSLKILYVLVFSATLLLGTSLNATIIIIMAFHRAIFKKNRPHQWTQIMGLAITHLVFCLITPLYLVSAWNEFSWQFGKSLCKLGSYVVFMIMFSNALIITLWNVRWCVPNRCFSLTHVSGIMTLLSCILGAILATPSLLSRDIQKTADIDSCLDNYDYKEMPSMSSEAKKRMLAVVLSRLIFGLVLPLGVIGISSRVRKHRFRSTGELFKSSRVLCPATFAHFLCWAPLLCLSMLQVVFWMDNNFFTYGLPFTTGLCALNSIIYPLICLIQGKKEREQDPTGPSRSEEESVF